VGLRLSPAFLGRGGETVGIVAVWGGELRPGHPAVLAGKQDFGGANCVDLVDRGLEFPGFARGEVNSAVGGGTDRKVLIVIEDKLDTDPIEVFRGVVDDNAAKMAYPELVGGPGEVLALKGVLVLGVGGAQTGYEQNCFHAAIEAIDSLTDTRDLKSEGIATKVAITIHMRLMRRHKKFFELFLSPTRT
jgi:hypothetical protein